MSRRICSKTIPDHFVFIAADQDRDPDTGEPGTPVREIIYGLARRNLWLGTRFMPFKGDYKRGDRVLIYAAGEGARSFVADARIADPLGEATAADRAVARGLGLFGFGYRIPLENVSLWRTEVPIKPLVGRLAFITNKEYYGHNLRQPAARIPAADYILIMKAAGQTIEK